MSDGEACGSRITRSMSGGIPVYEASPLTAQDIDRITARAVALGPLLLDLIQLDEADALHGIRAVVAERLRRLRAHPDYVPEIPSWLRELNLSAGSYAVAAALLAAEIDREAKA